MVESRLFSYELSAGGLYVSPMLIYKRKRMKAEMTDGAPPGTVFCTQEKGWMSNEGIKHIPVTAHNMRGCDSHLIVKHYEKHATLHSSVTAIPSNTEKFIAFQIGKLRFLYSLQLLSVSLDKLVGTLSSDAFVYTSKFYHCVRNSVV